jgi:hypothetical protein
VTGGRIGDVTLVEKVLEELRAIRKTADGLSLASLSQHPVLCAVLGDGDPAIALNNLKHRILTADFDLSIAAVSASLGLTSDQRTHLGRLEEFGAEHNYDQRQVRRYSDAGLERLATLIATNWTAPNTVPRLKVTAVQTAANTFSFFPRWQQQIFVEMQPVSITVYDGRTEQPTRFTVEERQEAHWIKRSCSGGIPITVRHAEVSAEFVWKGELWPKYTVQIVGDYRCHLFTSECLGNKLMLRVRPTIEIEALQA